MAVVACQAVSNIVKSSLGPVGLDKVVECSHLCYLNRFFLAVGHGLRSRYAFLLLTTLLLVVLCSSLQIIFPAIANGRGILRRDLRLGPEVEIEIF